jgi:Tfp pilus assembly protein PilN
MFTKALRVILVFSVFLVFMTDHANAQRMRKVWAKKKIVAYDAEGNKIDSLTKDLRNQHKRSKYLDQIQVDLHKIEVQMKKSKEHENKNELSAQREELLQKRIALIQEIKEDKDALVKQYFLVAGAYKKKKNALAAMDDWKEKGYKPFRFYNKFRKWHYVCIGMSRSYRKANLKQWNLKKEGIDTWIYYWAE